jgi:hypothetical protein
MRQWYLSFKKKSVGISSGRDQELGGWDLRSVAPFRLGASIRVYR